jgi:hypothetical protein
MSALLEFECRPAIGGYRIAAFDQRKFKEDDFNFDGDFVGRLPPNATEDERYLIEKWGVTASPMGEEPEVFEFLAPNSEGTRRFDLFVSDSSAFLKFARVPITPEGVIAFADQFGLLGSGEAGMIDDWYRQIKKMRRAVTAWEKANATDDFNAVVRLAERQGQQRGFDGGGGVNVLLKKDPLTGAPRLCLRPNDLLDALWIQLTLAIDGSQNLQTCAECRAWFTIEAGRDRSDKRYCSNACRMRAYRKRKGAQ